MTLETTPQVWGITGNLGGGKTLTAVYLAVNAMREGYYVCSNVTLKIDTIAKAYGEYTRKLYQHIDLDDPDFDPFKLPCGSPRGSRGGKRVLVLFDECAEWFDQYSTIKDPRIENLNSWLRHTSKRSQDVLLIVQRKEYLNKSIRSLISKWVVVDDMAYWRIPGLRLRLPFSKGYCMQRHFDRLGRLLRRPSFVCKRIWGQYYNTAECLNANGAQYNTEYEVPSRTSNYNIFYLLYALSIIILLL